MRVKGFLTTGTKSLMALGSLVVRYIDASNIADAQKKTAKRRIKSFMK